MIKSCECRVATFVSHNVHGLSDSKMEEAKAMMSKGGVVAMAAQETWARYDGWE
jgi:hypothetical protein